MLSRPEEPRRSAIGSGKHVAEPSGPSEAVPSPHYGPRGAFLVAGISVALLFIGWLAFYFLLFLPRGSIG
jgi:hypothetical protein